MIATDEFKGLQIFILGLGKTGLSILESLNSSGADIFCWDDSQSARDHAESLGFRLKDLNKKENWKDSDRLIISPGIPFLYPEPHKVVKTARESNVIIDNDIGLFFSTLGKIEWDRFQKQPKVVAITGSNGKSTTSFLIHHIDARFLPGSAGFGGIFTGLNAGDFVTAAQVAASGTTVQALEAFAWMTTMPIDFL